MNTGHLISHTLSAVLVSPAGFFTSSSDFHLVLTQINILASLRVSREMHCSLIWG